MTKKIKMTPDEEYDSYAEPDNHEPQGHNPSPANTCGGGATTPA